MHYSAYPLPGNVEACLVGSRERKRNCVDIPAYIVINTATGKEKTAELQRFFQDLRVLARKIIWCMCNLLDNDQIALLPVAVRIDQGKLVLSDQLAAKLFDSFLGIPCFFFARSTLHGDQNASHLDKR